MKCPHCLEYFRATESSYWLGSDLDPDLEHEESTARRKKVGFYARAANCSGCGRRIIRLVSGELSGAPVEQEITIRSERYIEPFSPNRFRFAAEIPAEFKKDYDEAVAVLAHSSNASAALSRRCLQNIIRTKAGITRKNLYSEIEALLDSGQLPGHIAKMLHPVRDLGNLGAHPILSATTGEVLPVTEEEAGILLEVLEGMLDWYFVQPLIQSERLQRISQKLGQKKSGTESGPEGKTTTSAPRTLKRERKRIVM